MGLQEAGLVKDSMISVYQRRRQQENGYEKDLSEQALADSLKKYNLLAEVWEDERSIMNGVLKFDVDEDFLAAKVPPGRIHGIVRNAENLSISLTVVRLSDCKYMKLCTNSKVRNIENDFVSFSAVLPAAIDRVCNLGRPTWAGSRSEDSLPSCCLFIDNISWTPAGREEGPRNTIVRSHQGRNDQLWHGLECSRASQPHRILRDLALRAPGTTQLSPFSSEER